MKKRGELDQNLPLFSFGEILEEATIKTIDDGFMTKDLCTLCESTDQKVCLTSEFIREIRIRIEKKLEV